MLSIFKNVVIGVTNAFKLGGKTPVATTGMSFSPVVVPCRTKYIDWRMLRDVNRRKVIKEHGKERDQLNCLRKNTILPKELREIAHKEVAAMPLNSCIARIHARCVLTSRARGRWRKFRMSRIIWRHLADYNQISGVERAMWGHTKKVIT